MIDDTRDVKVAGTTLYRLFDRRDVLLYIGIANNYGRRMEQHIRSKPWWPDVATTKIERFATRELALDAEREAIGRERPRYNVQHATADGRPRYDLTIACDLCGQPATEGWVHVDARLASKLRRDGADPLWQVPWEVVHHLCDDRPDYWYYFRLEDLLRSKDERRRSLEHAASKAWAPWTDIESFAADMFGVSVAWRWPA